MTQLNFDGVEINLQRFLTELAAVEEYVRKHTLFIPTVDGINICLNHLIEEERQNANRKTDDTIGENNTGS